MQLQGEHESLYFVCIECNESNCEIRLGLPLILQHLNVWTAPFFLSVLRLQGVIETSSTKIFIFHSVRYFRHFMWRAFNSILIFQALLLKSDIMIMNVRMAIFFSPVPFLFCISTRVD